MEQRKLERRQGMHISDLLGDRYLIVSILGQGGMGTVYLAEDLKLRGKQWAIKEIYNPDQDYQSFIDEAEILTKLDHPYLPGISDYFPPNAGGFSYLVMDFIRGVTLQELFFQHQNKLAADAVVTYALQLCDLFCYLHHELESPIIYRDLKPANIMIDDSGNARLIDFGIARNFKEGQQTDTVQIGTIGFAAPEQFENRQTDNRTDLYSLGALMYYLLSGGKYYYVTQKPLSDIQSDVHKELADIIARLTQTAPGERYPDARELKRDLEQVYKKLTGDDGEAKRAKVVIQERIIGSVVIAVTGVSKGIGCTHTAIVLAHFLARRGHSVALIEANESNDFVAFESAYEGGNRQAGGGKFSIEGVDYYKTGSRPDMSVLMAANYNYLILDIGFYEDNEWFFEFTRAHAQIVVASGIEWKQRELHRFRRLHHKQDQSHWLYALPFVGADAVDDVKKDHQAKHVYALPAHPDPYHPMKETDAALERILQPYMAREKPKRNVAVYAAGGASAVILILIILLILK